MAGAAARVNCGIRRCPRRGRGRSAGGEEDHNPRRAEPCNLRGSAAESCNAHTGRTDAAEVFPLDTMDLGRTLRLACGRQEQGHLFSMVSLTASQNCTRLVLKDLVEICRDSERTYLRAAREVQDPELARVFARYGQQRESYWRELEHRARILGGGTVPPDDAVLSWQRGWKTLRSTFRSHEPAALLGDCEQTEHAVVQAFREALRALELDDETRAIVQRQTAGVLEAHERMQQFRDSVAHVHQ